MTADLTPAQAARLEAIEAALNEQVVSVIATRPNEPVGYWTGPLAPHSARRLALAAIDVMRGATDDGAVGRVLRVVHDHERAHMPIHPVLIRQALGAPATAEGNDCG